MLRKFQLIAFCVVAGVLGVAFVASQVDKAMNYEPARARVVSVERSCILEKRRYKERIYTDPMPCDVAEYGLKNHPKYAGQGFEIEESGTTAFQYYGHDGETLTGSLRITKHPDGARIAPGDELAILVHKEDATKVRRP